MVNEWPTAEHKRAAMETAMISMGNSIVNKFLLLNIAGLVKSFMLELQYAGEIRKVPIIRCTLTQIGEKVNKHMQWVPVAYETSITVHFQNPDTLDYV